MRSVVHDETASLEQAPASPVQATERRIAEIDPVGRVEGWLLRFRCRHPRLFFLTALVVGGLSGAYFPARTYAVWRFEGVDLATALVQIICGGLLGGLVAVMLAYLLTRTLLAAGRGASRQY